MSTDLIKSALIRGIRTFVVAFLTMLATSAVGVVDVSTARAAVVSAIMFAGSAAWRAILDPSPLPSAQDPTGPVIAGTLTPIPPPRGA